MPTPITVAIAAFLALVLVGRWWLVNDLNTDRLLNRAFSWNLGGMLVWGIVARAGSVGLGEKLYLAIAVLGVVNIYGLGRLLDGADPAGTWTRQRRYDMVAAVASGLTVCSVLGLAGDWGNAVCGMLWAASNVVLAVAAALIARASLREVRAPSRSLRQRLAYALLFTVCLYSALAAPVGAVWAARGRGAGELSATWVGGSFLSLAVLVVVLAIPLVRALLTRTGWDSAGRGCRRLHPLWSDLTTAFPEVVLTPDSTRHPDSEQRLYRMTVEIRDALLQLKPFLPTDDQQAAGDAWRVAHALRAKTSGAAPVSATATAADPPADRAAELGRLFDLARDWPQARTALSVAAVRG
ncbi:MAB_1171c family putative transporter [Nocardia sp. NPDC051832]|uniref:MAB_1171c family putative transporter n=1 Tax=Nocardia sp. NPDC051832 TaxID=3155673 RepID=UPI0034280588